ncbi:hypothetical protein [Limosilactobacillus coleohominis]
MAVAEQQLFDGANHIVFLTGAGVSTITANRTCTFRMHGPM